MNNKFKKILVVYRHLIILAPGTEDWRNHEKGEC